MRKIERLNRIIEMNDEQKDKYFDVVYRRCHVDTMKFFVSNKDYIRDKLTGGQKKNFDKLLKNDELGKPFLKMIINQLDETREERFTLKMIKHLLKDNKELSESIASKKEYDENNFKSFLSSLEEDKRKELCGFFDALGFDTTISESDLEEANYVQENKQLKEQLDKLAKENDQLKTQNSNARKKIEEKENSIKELKIQIKTDKADFKRLAERVGKETVTLINKEKKKSEEIESKYNQLLEKNKTLEAENAELKNKPIEKVVEAQTTTQATEPSNKTEENAVESKFDPGTVLLDLEERTLLGVVKADGIQPGKNWIVVTPIVPIIPKSSEINRDDLYDLADFRGDYSPCLLFINQKLLDSCLEQKDVNNYQFYSNDDKYQCLFEAFCKKIVFFRLSFVETSYDSKYKLNAELVGTPVPFEEFNDSSFVPELNLTKDEFEKKIAKHQDLLLNNYPSSLSSNLRYVRVRDSIYMINYVSNEINYGGRFVGWKYGGEIDGLPFKKLDFTIDDIPNDKYILTPDAKESELVDLYVKNALLTEPSKKEKTAFDEDNFIERISENAKSMNLFYEMEDLKNFHVAVKSSNIVILAGPSGIGKTKLPLVYANALGLDSTSNTLLFVPISPSYLEPEDVLGYVKPITSDEKSVYNAEFMESQTGLVSFLIDAQKNEDRIHIVVFDEMNLSQIEHWFAPFISLLEQDPDSRILKLYSDNLVVKNNEKYPSSIRIGKNVFFIGTVNIDETTKQISDRLLDRAVIINLAAPSFTNLKNMGSAKPDVYEEVPYRDFETAIEEVDNAAKEFNEKESSLLNDLNTLLTDSVYNKGISFRSLTKMALYLKNSFKILTRSQALDFVISQIVVKKISGAREELETILCDDDTQGILSVINAHSGLSDFKKTRKAIAQKIEELNKYGFTR